MRAPSVPSSQRQGLARSYHGNISGLHRPHMQSKLRTRAMPPSAGGQQVDKGFSLLEWTNKLVPQSLLVSGVKEGWRLAWQTMVRELAPQSKSGAYKRQSYAFTGRIGDAEFPAESGRYHLYVGNACPWCHRVLLTLVLRGLCRPASGSSQPHITFTMLGSDPTKARRGGWIFDAQAPDPVWGAKDLWEVYDSARPGFTGRCTAPLLVDKRTRKVVSNESADIMRMLNGLHLPGCSDVDLVPERLARDIDTLNEQIYENVGNGVYASGFATTQQAYSQAQAALFSTLDSLEARLAQGPFLLGEQLTEADVRLLPTLARFDAVYAPLFKCTQRRIADYPLLSAWVQRMWNLNVEGSKLQVCDTVDVDAARASYFSSLFPLNPSGIVPSGPTAASLGLSMTHKPTVPVQTVCHRRAETAMLAS